MRTVVWGLVVILVACGPVPAARRPAALPPGVFGLYEDNDTGALNQSAWAFASASNTMDNPLEAIRAVIALEYLPRELRENPRWAGLDASIPLRLARARDQVRGILGIQPGASPQRVIDTLLALSRDLEAGNPAATNAVLGSPIFTRPAGQTMQTLTNLPYVRAANLATAQALAESQSHGGPDA